MSSFDYLVVGAGLTGSTFARLKADEGKRVLVIDKRPHIAGNAYDVKEHDFYVHKYGPHIFHTNSDSVFEFLSQFTEWHPYEHRVVANMGLGRPVVPIPFNFQSIDFCFEHSLASDMKDILTNQRQRDNQRFTLRQMRELALVQKLPELERLADFVFNYVFREYTQKMWNMGLDKLGPTVADRVPIVAGYDDRYFADKHQAIPRHGYTMMVNKMLNMPNITVRTSTEFSGEVAELAKKVYYTGPIDEFDGYRFGKLPYRGLKFVEQRSKSWAPHLDPAATMNFTYDRPTQTRVTSMQLLNGKPRDDNEVMLEEFPCDDERFYPYTTEEARDAYRKYEEFYSHPAFVNIKFAGRLGSYQYLDMHQAVAQAMTHYKDF